MFDIEEISAGFHDGLLSKYTDTCGAILDFYITDSMQDMLDIDIRSEVATVVGGVNEFTSLMSDLPSLDILDACANDGDLSWFGGPKWAASLVASSSDLYAESDSCINPNSVHTTQQTQALLNAIKMEPPLSPSPSPPPISFCTSDSNPLTLPASLMASPKVQPNLNATTFAPTNTIASMASPKECKSHLTFSPMTLKIPVVQETKKQSLLCQTQRAQIESIKKDLNDEMRDDNVLKPISQTIRDTNPTNTHQTAGSNTIKLAPGIGGLTFANSHMYARMKQNNGSVNKMVQNAQNISSQYKRAASPHRTIINQSASSPTLAHHNPKLQHTSIAGGGTHQIINGQLQAQPQKLYARNIIVQSNKTNGQMIQQIVSPAAPINKQIKAKASGVPEFPKPAYSYSCLIAMSLKNSRAGSLPVSEIYSFIMEHFPYFRTAARPWKNSVRHNLSLSKCFEKIEKPATNGGQRKGCLWVMNPMKIAKMDDEIQKWSRKDPMAIRKAMVFPENLGMLERGEMKHGSTGSDTEEGDDVEGIDDDIEENSSDLEPEAELDETIVNTPVTEVDEEEEEEGSEGYGDEEDDEEDEKPDFDIEIHEMMYDDFGLNTTKGSMHLTLNDPTSDDHDSPVAKRARLDINYSIAPAVNFHQQHLHHSSLSSPRTPSRTSSPISSVVGMSSVNSSPHLQPQQQNRRKMTLVNRVV